jgi:hypothetical protein
MFPGSGKLFLFGMQAWSGLWKACKGTLRFFYFIQKLVVHYHTIGKQFITNYCVIHVTIMCRLVKNRFHAE